MNAGNKQETRQNLILVTKNRFVSGAVAEWTQRILSTLDRIPPSAAEVKARMLRRSERDTHGALRMLGGPSSVFCTIVTKLGVDRKVVR